MPTLDSFRRPCLTLFVDFQIPPFSEKTINMVSIYAFVKNLNISQRAYSSR